MNLEGEENFLLSTFFFCCTKMWLESKILFSAAIWKLGKEWENGNFLLFDVVFGVCWCYFLYELEDCVVMSLTHVELTNYNYFHSNFTHFTHSPSPWNWVVNLLTPSPSRSHPKSIHDERKHIFRRQ